MARSLTRAIIEQSDSDSIEAAIVIVMIKVVTLLSQVTSSKGTAMTATVTAIGAVVVVGFVTEVITTFARIVRLSVFATVKKSAERHVVAPVLSCGVTS